MYSKCETLLIVQVQPDQWAWHQVLRSMQHPATSGHKAQLEQ